ncbi:hypothetical protein [Martelella alba]|nr:hypothetical protein [Martelella alba]
MDFDDILEILGDEWGMTLWGCAFEDFLTTDFEIEGGNIIDEYLKRRGWKENPKTRAYMKALRTSIMSLYEVSDVVPGKSLMARDLIRGGEPVIVSEGSATKSLKQWDRIAARIVPVMGENVLAGGLLPFTFQASDMLFDGLRHAFNPKNTKKPPIIKNEDLQTIAYMFSQTWLIDVLERETGMPELQNTDGDDIVFHNVRFPFAPGTLQKDIAARLNTLPALSRESEKCWNWLEENPRQKGRGHNAGRNEELMDSGARILGNLELKGKVLHLATNSSTRAQKGMNMVQQHLGNLIRMPLTEIRTVEQMMSDHAAPSKQHPASAIPPDMAEQVVHQFLDRQYQDVLDQPVGMLGNRSPRQAVKSAAGRQKVAEWLKYLENQSIQTESPTDPMATYSFEWMWRQLGILDLRH